MTTCTTCGGDLASGQRYWIPDRVHRYCESCAGRYFKSQEYRDYALSGKVVHVVTYRDLPGQLPLEVQS